MSRRCPCGGTWRYNAVELPPASAYKVDRCKRCGRWRWRLRKL